ncbi:BnaA04g13240D [Brassica napus]|uniref:BnaA04g13240D protein n=1 Tax=Brassica napus TaxID=3708 RepID=A0A078GKF9_BRANA|nr:BnaA04g13240D [Brassica napus]
MISRVFDFMKKSKSSNIQLNNTSFLDLLPSSSSTKPKALNDVFINTEDPTQRETSQRCFTTISMPTLNKYEMTY